MTGDKRIVCWDTSQCLDYKGFVEYRLIVICFLLWWIFFFFFFLGWVTLRIIFLLKSSLKVFTSFVLNLFYALSGFGDCHCG